MNRGRLLVAVLSVVFVAVVARPLLADDGDVPPDPGVPIAREVEAGEGWFTDPEWSVDSDLRDPFASVIDDVVGAPEPVEHQLDPESIFGGEVPEPVAADVPATEPVASTTSGTDPLERPDGGAEPPSDVGLFLPPLPGLG